MSTIQEQFTIRGMDCYIETTDGGVAESHASLLVEVDGRVITDASGYCSPIYAAFNGREGWKIGSVHGAARDSMIRRILRESVEAEIEAHADFCRRLVADGEIDTETGREV